MNEIKKSCIGFANVPGSDPDDGWTSITAEGLIEKLKKLPSNAVILSWDGLEIKRVEKDKNHEGLFYLTHRNNVQ